MVTIIIIGMNKYMNAHNKHDSTNTYENRFNFINRNRDTDVQRNKRKNKKMEYVKSKEEEHQQEEL